MGETMQQVLEMYGRDFAQFGYATAIPGRPELGCPSLTEEVWSNMHVAHHNRALPPIHRESPQNAMNMLPTTQQLRLRPMRQARYLLRVRFDCPDPVPLCLIQLHLPRALQLQPVLLLGDSIGCFSAPCAVCVYLRIIHACKQIL